MTIIPKPLIKVSSLLVVSLISVNFFSYEVYAEDCVDEPGLIHSNGKNCAWVSERNSQWRCTRGNATSMCKKTCGTCECHDSVTFVGTFTSRSFNGKQYRCRNLSRMGNYDWRQEICRRINGATENCQASCKNECQIWSQLGSDINGEATGDHSGVSVALSSDGKRVAIGADHNDDVGFCAGSVRVYEFDGTSWIKLGSDIDGEDSHNYFGTSVSLSQDGGRVAIGAYKNHGASGSSSGHVRIYEFDGSSWTQLGIDIDGENAGDESGWSVSLSSDGGRVAIGAMKNDGGGHNSGSVRIYDFDDDSVSWTKVGGDIDGVEAGDFFGRSVSMSDDGSRVAIGSRLHNTNDNVVDSGLVKIYEYIESAWTQVGSNIYGEEAYDYSGQSVSLSGDGERVAIGAYGNDENGNFSGHARIFKYDGSSWIQIGSDINGEAAGDYSGWSVSLSANGLRIAIGAEYNDGNGISSGHVRIYQNGDATWKKVGVDIDGEAAGDHFGGSVSLSGDGKRVAIGAWGNDDNGNNSGHARVFTIV